MRLERLVSNSLADKPGVTICNECMCKQYFLILPNVDEFANLRPFS
jgi:hypothetical protein